MNEGELFEFANNGGTKDYPFAGGIIKKKERKKLKTSSSSFFPFPFPFPFCGIPGEFNSERTSEADCRGAGDFFCEKRKSNQEVITSIKQIGRWQRTLQHFP